MALDYLLCLEADALDFDPQRVCSILLDSGCRPTTDVRRLASAHLSVSLLPSDMHAADQPGLRLMFRLDKFSLNAAETELLRLVGFLLARLQPTAVLWFEHEVEMLRYENDRLWIADIAFWTAERRAQLQAALKN